MYENTEAIETKALKVILDKYLVDITNKTSNELYAIFEIINKEYIEKGMCPICDTNFNYNIARITCQQNLFVINNGIIDFALPTNYCPVCGKKQSK
jgi:hypothetical protein